MALVLRNGLVDLGGGKFERADVAVADGRIVASNSLLQAEVLDCSRFAVVPGMVNAHAHSNENWFRGLWDNLPLEPWMLFSYPVLAAPAQSADEIYTRTLLGGIELLRSGATTVVDFLYDDENALEPVVRAYRDLGLRALIAIGMGDRAYHETVVLDEGLVSRDLIDRLEREKPPSWYEWSEVARRAVERYHRPDEGISICLAPSGPQRCTDEMLAGCAALAAELDLMIHIHVLETRMQAVSGQRMYGRTLPEHMDALGFLSPRVCFEHGIWLTPSDMELVRDRGVTVVHNPVSNMKLGSGIAPIPELLRHGVNVALGTDGMCSNESGIESSRAFMVVSTWGSWTHFGIIARGPAGPAARVQAPVAGACTPLAGLPNGAGSGYFTCPAGGSNSRGIAASVMPAALPSSSWHATATALRLTVWHGNPAGTFGASGWGALPCWAHRILPRPGWANPSRFTHPLSNGCKPGGAALSFSTLNRPRLTCARPNRLPYHPFYSAGSCNGR